MFALCVCVCLQSSCVWAGVCAGVRPYIGVCVCVCLKCDHVCMFVWGVCVCIHLMFSHVLRSCECVQCVRRCVIVYVCRVCLWFYIVARVLVLCVVLCACTCVCVRCSTQSGSTRRWSWLQRADDDHQITHTSKLILFRSEIKSLVPYTFQVIHHELTAVYVFQVIYQALGEIRCSAQKDRCRRVNACAVRARVGLCVCMCSSLCV